MALNANAKHLARVDWRGQRVTVMGLGSHGGGVAAARFLAERGARVTVSDTALKERLAESLAALSDLPLAAVHLGGHEADDFRTPFVVVNPAVPPGHPCLELARRAGARLLSETELFLALCPGRVIGVTGTVGKSTTCAMLHQMLVAGGKRAWLGGNIGHSLLGDLPAMTADDWVVLEMSSFQLAHLSEDARLPEIGVITNCSPNHLDWHGSWEAYVAAKQRLLSPAALSHQGRGARRIAVLNHLDAEVASWSVGAESIVPPWPVERIPPLLVPGAHNRRNAACAAAAATITGVDGTAIARVLAEFRGLPHRIEFVAELDGRRFFNDSKSTTTAATCAALTAVDGPVWLLAGGEAKGAEFRALAGTVVMRALGAAFFGACRSQLCQAVTDCSVGLPQSSQEELAEAIAWCWQRSRPGDAILLSPACASFDQFRDYQERGERFRGLVAELARTTGCLSVKI